MAFSLGSIFVELTCNTAKFLTGMDKASVAAKKTGKDIRSGLGTVSSSLSALGPVGAQVGLVLQGVGDKAASAFDVAANKGRGFAQLMSGLVLGSVVGLVGGLAALAKHAASVGAEIYEASEKTGIGAAQMSGLMAITKETNGDFGALTTSLARAGANLSGLAEHGKQSGENVTFLARAAKAAGDSGLKPMGDRIQAVLKQIFSWNNEGDRNKALSELLGRGWMGNVSVLRLLAEQGYGPAMDAARRFGIFFDDNAARQAKQFTVQMSALEGQLSGMVLTIGQRLVPSLGNWMTGLRGTGSAALDLAVILLKLGAISVATATLGAGLPAAWAMWKEGNKLLDQNAQAQTDYMTLMDALSRGAAGQGGGGGKEPPGGPSGFRERLDVLKELIASEQDQIQVLASSSRPVRALALDYKKTTEEIQKAVDAGGNYAEALTAWALAGELFGKKLMALPGVIPQTPSLGELAFAAAGPLPAFGVPGGPQPALSMLPAATPSFAGSTPAGMAALKKATDGTEGMLRAVRLEGELSASALLKLATAFPGLTNAEITATAAGRNYITLLARMDKEGTTFGEHFTELKNDLIAEGADLGGKLTQTIGGALDQLEDQLANLATGGKVNFRRIATGLEQSFAKMAMQKGVSSLLGHFGMGGHTKPDGTQGNPLFVRLVDAVGMGGMFGGRGGQSATGTSAQGGSSFFSSGGIGSVFQSLGQGIGSIASTIGHIFGGFLASGGDATPGKAYVVGERHPEFFMPKQAGQVVPSVKSETLRPLVYSPTFHVNTPDADSFRRSQSQLLTDGYRTMTSVHGRNS